MAEYTTQRIDGDIVWFNQYGEQVAHYTDMLLHRILLRTLTVAEESGKLTEAEAMGLEELIITAWPLSSEDTAEQFTARSVCVEAFRRAGLIA